MDIRYFNKKGEITFSDFNKTKPMTVKTEVEGTEHSLNLPKEMLFR